MATTKLEIVSPDGIVYEADIAMLIARAIDGAIGIMPHHAPLATVLVPHPMGVKLEGDRKEQLIAVAGGFMEVTPDKITVLATAAEEPVNIDILRAKKSRDRALERLKKLTEHPEMRKSIDVERAQLSLQRALARLKATGEIDI